jgi:tRNA A37 threonylcarbamoyladenosine dehydratase
MLSGEAAVEKLRRSHVTVVGLGAVGSFALESLARCGIGRFRLVDFDVVRPSNCNRQLLAIESTLGRKKVDVARERVLGINPGCVVDVRECFFDADGFASIFTESTDIVVDAIDSLNPKTSLLALLVRNGIPVVSSMGAARKIDPGRVVAGDIAEVSICSLGLRLRKRLKKLGIADGIRCVYSTEVPHDVARDAIGREEESFRRGRERVPFGSVVFVPAAFGIRLGYEVFHRILHGQFPAEHAMS